jgi:lipopolysaccharide transport system ATP-binding protein
LLKILSRISEPTKGRISIKGRIASLLEVGTGFHPELTGRENIYLNGAILGMSKAEIKRKFDEIVAFAEVEKFLDTPVKRYSSGMYVRLAFAVAAHLQTDILLVDEVLAVGDAEFQKKCLGKMQDVSQHGRTVLFVSHDLTSISRLCQHGLVLTSGYACSFNNIEIAINHYRSNGAKENKIQEWGSKSGIYISEAWLPKSEIYLSQPAILWVHLIIKSNKSILLSLDWRIYDQLHHPVGYGSSKIMQNQFLKIEEGENYIELGFHLPPLATGSYLVEFDLCIPWSECFFRSTHPLEFNVIRCNPFGANLDFKQEWGYGAVPIQSTVKIKDNSYYKIS